MMVPVSKNIATLAYTELMIFSVSSTLWFRKEYYEYSYWKVMVR